jgi:hypothetical protein
VNDDHAIVVGINEYPGLSSLSGPCADAQEFVGWLEDSDGGDVPGTQIHSLLTTHFHPPGPNGIGDVHPVEDEVNNLFRPLVTLGMSQGRAGRRLYVYLAGHGFSDASDMESAALYAANAEFTFAPHVAGTAYANWFRRNGTFDEIVLLMDCCRTTSPMQSIRPPPLPNTNNPSMAAKVKTFYAYGTSWGAVARERPMDGSIRGIFTTALLRAIKNAIPNERGRVTGQILKNYIHNIFDDVAGGTDTAPPDIKVDSSKDIAFVEGKQAAEFPVRVRLASHIGDERLLVTDGSGKKVKELDCTEDSLVLDLLPGFYKALIVGTDRSKLFEVVGNDVDITV